MATLYVVLPALDEAPNIGRVLTDLRAARERLDGVAVSLVLVDDGSTDGTGAVARSLAGDLPLQVIRHEAPRGPGAAFASGFAHVSGVVREDDYVLTLEADNTSRVEVLDLMFRRLEEGHDVAFASPYMYGGGIVQTSALRIGLSHLANAFVKEFLGIHGLLTVSSFYRLYTGGVVRRLQAHYGPGIVEREGFECMVELVLKLVYLRMRIAEVPMVLDTDRRVGRSKMRIGRTGVGYLALFLRKREWRERAVEPF